MTTGNVDAEVVRSRYERQQPEMPGHRQWKGACDGPSVMKKRMIGDADKCQSAPSGRVHQRDRRVSVHADRQRQPA